MHPGKKTHRYDINYNSSSASTEEEEEIPVAICVFIEAAGKCSN